MRSKIKNLGETACSQSPLYKQMADNLRHLILNGEIAAGEALPSERELVELTGISRVTVRKAIELLIGEGILFRLRGSGTYITSSIEQSGEDLTGFTSDALDRGESPSSFWLMRNIAKPTASEAEILKIDANERVVRFGRVRMSNGEPLAIEHAVIPMFLLPEPQKVEESLYDILKERKNYPVTGTQKLLAALATPTEAALLSIPENSAILRIERKTFLEDKTPVEFTRSVYRGDKYSFTTELHLDS